MSEEVSKRRRGCFFYGCLTGVVLLLVVLILALAGLSYVKRALSGYTDTKPAVLPTVQMASAEVEKLRQRVAGFQQAVHDSQPTEPLSLSADEINALIANEPDLVALKDRVYVTIEGDRVKGQVSVPMGELGLPMFRDRYLNGTATFGISLQNGVLRVNAEDVVVKGKKLPDAYLKGIREQNLAQRGKASQEPGALDQLKDIQVKEGKLILTPKVER